MASRIIYWTPDIFLRQDSENRHPIASTLDAVCPHVPPSTRARDPQTGYPSPISTILLHFVQKNTKLLRQIIGHLVSDCRWLHVDMHRDLFEIGASSEVVVHGSTS
jgi:hypothetical protein